MVLPPDQKRSDRVTGCLLCLIICCQVLSGCAAPPRKTGPMPYPTALSSEAIAGEIENTEKALSQLPEEQGPNFQRPGLLLHLAMLHAHPDSPSRDNSLAIDYLEQYASLEKAVDVEFAISLLTRLSRCQAAVKQACARLSDRNEQLERQYRELAGENQQLKEIIEKLKHLDIQLEKRRKSF